MGTHRLIYIRTDGNSKIASGHLMRCFSVALACQELGMEVRFLVSDEESFRLLKDIIASHKQKDISAGCMHHNFSVIKLKNAAYDNLELELNEASSLLSSSFSKTERSAYDVSVANSNVTFFLDSYYVTEKYLSALRPFAKIAYLDDLQLFDYPADLVINYDIIPKASMPVYRTAYKNAGKLLLGAAYTPLRRQFWDKYISIKEQATDILLTTGGSDPYHFCLHMLQSFISEDCSAPWNATDFPGITFHMVIGKLNNDRETLWQYAEKLPFFRLYENVSDMASLMCQCDLAVSAAGTTLYELCALGIPTVSFAIADNQLAIAKAFDGEGAVFFAGDFRYTPSEVYRKIMTFLTDMSQKISFCRRKSIHDTMRRLVDGKGAPRIAKALLEL